MPLHLYERHDRPAEGRQHQPLPRPGDHVRLQRRDEDAPGGPHLCLPADVPHLRRRARPRRGADGRRERGAPRAVFRLAVLGRHRQERLHGLPVYRRALPLPPEQPRRIRRRRRTGSGLPAATASGPTSGRISRSASASRKSSNGTPRPRATASSSISTARSARSAASRNGSRGSSSSRSCASTSTRSSRCAAPTGCASNARPARSARRSRKILNDPKRPSQRFEGYADPARRRRRSCAMPSRRATAGSAPAISCARTRSAITISSTGSATRFAGRARTSPRRRCRRRSPPFPASRRPTSTAFACRVAEGRAGMAALVVGRGPRPRRSWPTRGRAASPPMPGRCFLRMKREIETTTTFKQRKIDLVKQGFDPTATADPIYFLHPELQTYVRLDSVPLWRHLRGQGAALSDKASVEPAGRRGVLARAGRGKMVQEGRGISTAPSWSGSARCTRTPPRGVSKHWAETAGRRARADPAARPVLPQHVPRRSPKAFAQDELAASIARKVIDAGFDRRCPPDLRFFSTCPSAFRIDRRPGALRRAVSQLRSRHSPLVTHASTSGSSGASAASRIVIAILGRHTTPAEQAFLEGGGFAG